MVDGTLRDHTPADISISHHTNIENEHTGPRSDAHESLLKAPSGGIASDVHITEVGHSDANSSTLKEDGFENPEMSGAYRTLKRSATRQWFSTIFDTVLSLVPLFFLVIAILCLCLNGQQLSPYGQNVKAITLLSPTIFPIIYAAILGKVLRRIGLYKAERSSTIGTLEQLVGSQSFFASIERQFGLRHVNFLGIMILAAWLLSPLGGQSSLRLLSERPFITPINVAVKYHAIEGFSQNTLFNYDMEESNWNRYAPLYMTALQTSRQTFDQPRDLFGNVRIPDISSVSRNASQSLYDWHAIEDESSMKYTSLLGIPTVDIPQPGNISFALDSSYWEIRCHQFVPGAEFQRPGHSKGNSTSTDPYNGKLAPGPSGTSFNFDGAVEDMLVNSHKIQFIFNYLSKTASSEAINSTCTAILRIVESEVGCEAGACSVRKMRTLDRDVAYMFPPMAAASPLKGHWTSFFWMLCDFLPGVDLGPENTLGRSSELVEQWLSDPYSALTNPKLGSLLNFVNLSTIPPEVFSNRLQVAMNTFWDSTMTLEYRMGNLTSQDIKGKNASETAWNTTEAIGARYDGEKYVCHSTFAALTIIISILMFLAASISVILGFITKAPDILGYVSTYARDNPYFGKHVPSHLDGLETTRALRDVRVIIGDVRKEDDVGHVAFASMDKQPERVSKKRLYD